MKTNNTKAFRQKVSEILVKWSMPTRQVAINEIVKAYEAEVKSEKQELLSNIVKANTDDDLGTVDYDGVAQDVLSEIRRFEQ